MNHPYTAAITFALLLFLALVWAENNQSGR